MPDKGVTSQPETSPPKRRRRWPWIAAVLALAPLLALALFIQSQYFQDLLRRRIELAIQDAAGGTAELGRFTFAPGKLEVLLDGLTVHGRERPGEPPLFTAESIEARWRILSFWGLNADLRVLRISKPKLSVLFRDDGSTNLPPPIRKPGERSWAERVLDLQAQHFEILRGQVRLRTGSFNRSYPLDVEAENVLMGLDYDPRSDRYAGKLDLQRGLVHTLAGIGKWPAFSGRAKFSLDRDKVAVDSLELQMAHSKLSAQGSLSDFLSPVLQFRYGLALDGKEVGDLLGKTGWQGEIAWRGQGSYAREGWQLEGPLTAHAARMGIPSLQGVSWTAGGGLRVTGPRLDSANAKSAAWRAILSRLEVTALGGRITGGAVLEASRSAPSTRLDLKAENIGLPALSGLLQGLGIPFQRLPWAGSVSGPFQVSFLGEGKTLVLHTDWQIDPSPVVPPGFTSVSGDFRANYQGDQNRLEIERGSLRVGSSSFAADGWLDARDSRLSFTADVANYEDIRPFAEMVSKQAAALPLSLHGRSSANILWTGPLASPRIAGTIRLADFEFRKAAWDSLSGSFEYSETGLVAPPGSGRRSRESAERDFQPRAISIASPPRGAQLKIDSAKLVRGSAEADFSAVLQLADGVFRPASPFSLQAALRQAKLDDLQQLYGTHFPVHGILQGSFQAQGTRADPRGHGDLALTSGEAYGEAFAKLTVQVSLDPGNVLTARNLRLQKGQGTLQGEGSISLGTKEYRFSASGSNLDLKDFQFLQAQSSVMGLAQGTLSGAGNLSRPAVQGRLEIEKLGVAGEPIGQMAISIDSHDGRAKAEWTASGFGGELRGTGEAQLQAPFPFSAHADFQNMDVVSLMRSVQALPENFQGRASGTVAADGDLEHRDAIRSRGELSALNLTAGAMAFRNPEPARFIYQNRELQLDRWHLTAKNTDIEASGTVSLAANAGLKLGVKGHMDLAALAVLDPDLTAAGQVSLDASVSGTPRQPLWRGRVDFNDASVRYGSLPNGLSKIKGALIFQGSRAGLENVTAESGGGTVKLAGLVTYAAEPGIGAQLDADIRGVRVRYPEGISTWLDGRLTLTGSLKASTLAGRLVINKETASSDFDIGAVLLSGKGHPLAVAQAAPLQNLRLDVQIVSSPNLSLETTTAKNLRGDVDLRIQGSLDHPSWLGRISILEGEITIGGRSYVADRGELTFSNPFRIEPILNLQVRARVEQYDVSLNFSGPLDHLAITYSSDPPLQTSEILPLLIAGGNYANTLQTTPTTSTPDLGPGSILSQTLATQMGSRLDRLFGAGHVRIDPQIAGFDKPANASVALEQHIKNNLTLLYVTNVTTVQQGIIQAELTLNPRFSVTAIRDQNGLIGVNFQIKLRFR